ncbi:uncharacterized protein BX663DRAFT_444621 [Cokeromyces recurvatus]|uniref:uncharacterized protein n=1 Tax=Cokeromyces recurvatus TaxID=90255 RepID=UPI00222020E1|nr:uncharacterized protein BX663DRAFT_444621 [Cokeromyces recurvatus]KAI7897691.1 hypothetical protein BX663DRAFT_444621 [Cokeromyces recurvatus]
MNHDISSFWLICDNQTCHCDWRVTIVDCKERETMIYIYIINAVCSLINSFLSNIHYTTIIVIIISKN